MTEGESMRNAPRFDRTGSGIPRNWPTCSVTCTASASAERSGGTHARSVLRFDPRAATGCSVVPARVEAGLYVEVAGLPIWRKPAPPARLLLIVGSEPGA